MNFEIFFALIGLPLFILIIGVICYVHSGIKEEIMTLKSELRKQSTPTIEKKRGGMSS